MSVRLIIDSGCDMPQEEAREQNVTILPLTTTFGEVSYRDGIDITSTEFFEKLVETNELPVTSQITPAQYEEAFREVKASGDTAVCITVASSLSGCYNSARIALDGYEDCVTVIDSENVTIGELILLKYAIRLRNEGKSAKDIASILETEKKHIHIIALLDTLEYLKKGGRISAAVAIAGSLLGIKPVVSVETGNISMLGKARGSRNGSNLLNEFVKKTGGICYDKPIVLAYSGLSDSLLRKYIADSSHLYSPDMQFPIYCIGSTIGTHVGPGAIAVAFFDK